MSLERKGKVRLILYLTAEDEMLLRVCRRVTALDKTSTVRLMMRRGCLLELGNWLKSGVPKLPEDLEKFVKDF